MAHNNVGNEVTFADTIVHNYLYCYECSANFYAPTGSQCIQCKSQFTTPYEDMQQNLRQVTIERTCTYMQCLQTSMWYLFDTCCSICGKESASAG